MYCLQHEVEAACGVDQFELMNALNRYRVPQTKLSKYGRRRMFDRETTIATIVAMRLKALGVRPCTIQLAMRIYERMADKDAGVIVIGNNAAVVTKPGDNLADILADRSPAVCVDLKPVAQLADELIETSALMSLGGFNEPRIAAMWIENQRERAAAGLPYLNWRSERAYPR